MEFIRGFLGVHQDRTLFGRCHTFMSDRSRAFKGLSRIDKGSLVISNGLVGDFLSLQRFQWGQYALYYCER